MYTKRKQFLTCAVMLCLSVNVSAQTHSQKEAMIHKVFATDERCLTLADFGQMYAESLNGGVSEAKLLSKANMGHWSDRIHKNIIRLVATMKLDGDMARQLVYVRCLGGEYNPTVKEMGK